MVGSVQEDLGLFLDALQTYQGALSAGQLEARYTGALWSRKRRRLVHLLRFTGSTIRQLRRHPEWIKLRFQYARTLGYADRVMAQWLPHNPGADGPGTYADTRYHRESRQNRERLCAAMAERYWPAVLTYTRTGTRDEAKQQVRLMLRDPSSALVVLQLAAWQEFHRLYEDLQIASLVPGTSAGFDRRLIRLMRDVWSPLRLMRALHRWRYGRDPRPDETPERIRFELESAGCLSDWWTWWRRRGADRALAIGWPASPALLGDAIFTAQRRWNRLAPLGYLDYYHAGCVYAFALQGFAVAAGTRPPDDQKDDSPPPVADREGETLTYRAVENLREALMCTESGRAGRITVQSDTQAGTASRLRTWIATSDPDLARLRNRAEFRFFQQDAYHPMKPVPLRPEDVTEVRVTAYAKSLLCEGARLLERHWHRRRRDPSPRYVHDLVQWLRLDDRTWTVLERIALDRARYWADRAEFARLITQAVALLRTTDHHYPPPVPVYDDLILDEVERLADDRKDLPRVVDEAVARQVQRIDLGLARLADHLAGAAAGTAHRSDHRLRRMDVNDLPLGQDDFARICMARAKLWQEVIEVLDDTDLIVDATTPEDEQTEP